MKPRSIVRLALACVVLGVLAGAGSAGFLWSLDQVTRLQAAHPWLLFCLPGAGVLIAWLYSRYGREAEAGNNFILDQIHAPSGRGVPLRMFPLVLAGTLGTHLFGGSAGREGTAVQMGGSLAGALARALRLDQDETRLLLMAGISAGFGSVFGTPLAGAIFGMEVLALGGMRYEALLPCLLAAVVGDQVVQLIGIPHSHYLVPVVPALSAALVAKVALAGVAFGGASALFAELAHAVASSARRLVARPLVRAGAGGVLVVAVTLLLGTRSYNGLSLPLLHQAFAPEGVPTFAFLAKLLLTALTLGVGFKGGEVTPLFVIGATLGATLGTLLGVPPPLMAALGFIAVFAAAANTPLACILMGVELFGASPLVLLAIATFVAYTVSGHRGIYLSQRIVAPKLTYPTLALHDVSLREARQRTNVAILGRVKAWRSAYRQNVLREGTMLGFEVWLNGRRLGVCGDPSIVVLTAILGFVPRRDELYLQVGGMVAHGPDDDEQLTWIRQNLQRGDRVELRLVDLEAALEPLERSRAGADVVRQGKRRAYEALRRAFEAGQDAEP